jgi:ABC-type transporter Mla subunit MlaD
MRRRSGAVLANPVLVGAVTVLVIVVAVFLAYNANNGLPFVPTYELRANVPSGAKLVPGNDIREGGHRIGVVTELNSKKLRDGSAGAEIVMKLDKNASPLPADTSLVVRPRSALGLKYVELERGKAKDTLPAGATITAGEEAIAPELQEFFNIFDQKTRDNVERNLTGFGNAFAGRGISINQALESFPGFLRRLPPVMDVLASSDLERFFSSMERAARITAPLAETAMNGFRDAAITFNALVRDPAALEQTIADSPETLAVGTTALRNSRPFLRSLANVSGDLRDAAAEIRRSTPTITTTLNAGITPLEQLPTLNRRLTGTFNALTDLARSQGSDAGVNALGETTRILTPLTRYLGPFITVCNHWNYSWTYLSDHISDQDQSGTVQRIRAKEAPPGSPASGLSSYGAAQPIDTLHAQSFGAAVGPNGEADCETGQRGFPRHLAEGIPDDKNFAADAVTPGLQGPTFTGQARVPEGETFDAAPNGTSFNARTASDPETATP